MKSFFERSRGYLLFLFLSFLPLYFWISMMPIKYRFSDFYDFFLSLGQISGLIGMAIFSLTMILSVRWHILDKLFLNAGRVYRAHHLLGGLSFLLLLLHPLFLFIAGANISPGAFIDYFLPGANLATNLGTASLLFMIAVLLITFLVEIANRTWRLTHKLIGFPLFLGFLHLSFTESDVSRDMGLRTYMIIIVCLGFAFYIYQIVFSRFFRKIDI